MLAGGFRSRIAGGRRLCSILHWDWVAIVTLALVLTDVDAAVVHLVVVSLLVLGKVLRPHRTLLA